MTSWIAKESFACRRGDLVIAFEVAIGAPYREEDLWYCDWSLAGLLDHSPRPACSSSSLHALFCAQLGIFTYLQTRQNMGDRFYLGSAAEESEVLDRLDLFFPSLRIGEPAT